MRRCIKCSFLVTLVFITPYALIAQESLKIGKISGIVEFDGHPFEEVWNGATMFPLVVSSPNFGTEPSERSEVMIGYDQEFIWIAARLFSKDASKITSTSKKRDEESRNSDAFGIILDTYDDNENALAFFTIPSGSRIDYTVSNDGEGGGGPGRGAMNLSWNTFWDVETSMDEQGWYVEMRIPFSSLRFQNEDGIIRMGMILNRRISYKNEIDTYPDIDPKYGFTAYVKPSLAQTIEFKDIEQHNPVYFAPYAIGGYSSSYELNGDETQYLKEDKPEFDAGLDIKYSLTSNLTLDLTANTDFAQVEADDQQANLTRYSLFFPEKRLFFQERSGIFNYSLGGRSDNLFYSRRIGIVDDEEQVRIFGGARLTGRINKLDVGILDMQTEKFGENPSENFGIARLRRQVINQNSYVGGIITSRLGTDGSYNVACGADGIFRLFGDDYVDVRLAQTYQSEADSNALEGEPSFAGIRWERRSDEGFAYDLSYNYIGSQFNPEVGFLRRNDIQGIGTRFQYGWLPGEQSKLFSARVMLQVNRYNRLSDGGLESMEISPGWMLMTKGGFGSFVEFQSMKEGVLEDFDLSDDVIVLAGDYNFIGFQGRFWTPQTYTVSSMFRLTAGEFYDGRRFSIQATPILNLSSSLQLSGTYEFNAVDFPGRDQSLRSFLGMVKILYMYSTKISASTFIQFNNADDVLIGNFRLRYNPREGNDFYLVLNDYRCISKTVADPVTPPYYNQAVLLKYTHTFRL